MEQGDKIWVGTTLFLVTLIIGWFAFSWLKERRDQKREDENFRQRLKNNKIDENGVVIKDDSSSDT